MTKPHPLVGQTFHFLLTGVTYLAGSSVGGGAVSTRGDELVITDELIESNTDRNGWCWLELLTDPDTQIARHGRQLIAEGPAPDGILTTEPGTADHALARSRALAAAYAEPDPKDRAVAVAGVRETYGEQPTSKTLATFG